MKVKAGRMTGGIKRAVLRQIAETLSDETDDGSQTGRTAKQTRASDEDALRRARRESYAAEALREQREEGRRIREAYRQARASQSPRGETPRPGGAPRQAAGQQTRTFHYRGRTVPDYYDVLEVSPRARQSVIDKAYRALMREDHPDQGGDARKAQLLNEAYEVLGDAAKRREYDRENGLGS